MENWSERQPVALKAGDAILDGLPQPRCGCRLPLGVFGMGAVHGFYPSVDWHKRRLWAESGLVNDWRRRGEMPPEVRRALEARVFALFHGDHGDHGSQGLILAAERLAEQRQPVVLCQCPEARLRAERAARVAKLDQPAAVGGFTDGEW